MSASKMKVVMFTLKGFGVLSLMVYQFAFEEEQCDQ